MSANRTRGGARLHLLGLALVWSAILLTPAVSLAQTRDGAAWLDDAPLQVAPNSEGTATLVNLSGSDLSLVIEVVGSTDLGLEAAPPQVTIAPSDSVEITLTSTESEGSATLVAWGDGTLVEREIVVGPSTSADPPLPLPDSLALEAELDPLNRQETIVTQTLPAAVARPEQPPCETAGWIVVGRLSGPRGATAPVCTDGVSLQVRGVKEPGTWSGKIDLLPDDDPGSVSVSLTARDSPWFPVSVLILGLLAAYALGPLATQWRSRALFEHFVRRDLDRVDAKYRSTRDAIATLADDPTVGLPFLHDPSDPLLLDARVAELRVELSEAVDASARVPFLAPDGTVYKDRFAEVVKEVLRIYTVLLSSAELAADLRQRLADDYRELKMQDARLPRLALSLGVHRINDKNDWDAIVKVIDTRDADLRTWEGFLGRIDMLKKREMKLALVKDLFLRHEADGLEEHEQQLLQKEAEDKEAEDAPPGAEFAGPPIERPRVRLRQLTVVARQDEHSSWRRPFIALFVLLLVAIAYVQFGSGELGLLPGEGPTLGIVVSFALAVAVGYALVHGLFERLSPRQRLWALDWWVALVGGLVTVVSGYATQYLADATFGGLADYITIGTWGFALGSGVTVARRIITHRSVEAV